VRAALLAAGGRAAAVLIVSPTYHGVLSDIPAIARECAAAGVPLIVDEAHGAHLRFLPGGLGCPSNDSSTAPDAVAISATGGVRPGGGLSAPPLSALDCGADLVVHSVHKTLSSATQTAMLHASAVALAARPQLGGALCRALDQLQSSSPSYLLLASLDAARSVPHVWRGERVGESEFPSRSNRTLFQWKRGQPSSPSYLLLASLDAARSVGL